MHEMDTAWLAGLYEGEGSIVIQRRPSGASAQVTLSIGSTDSDVIVRCASITQAGHIGGPYKGTRKPRFVWRVTRFDEVEQLCAALYPFLAERRRSQIDRVLGEARVYKGTTALMDELRKLPAPGMAAVEFYDLTRKG
jgi:hypothetical protein